MARPTKMQMTALKYIATGMSGRQAMLKAGYKETSARRPKQALLDSPRVSTMLEKVEKQLDSQVDATTLVKKLLEFLDAKKPIIDKDGEKVGEISDYKTQIEGFDRIAKIMKIEGGKDEGKVSRKIELTEYINEDTEKPPLDS